MKKFTSTVHIPLVDMKGIEAQDHQDYYDPVIDPSDMIGWLIVNDEVREFSVGLRYLHILENRSQNPADLHRGKIPYSDQLRRDIPISLMLAEVASTLKKKAQMSEADFVSALEELKHLLPDITTEVDRFTESEQLVSLILHRSLVIRRVMACRSFLPPGTSLVEAACDLVGIQNISLESNDTYFSQYQEWLTLFQGKGLSWSRMLHSVDMLIQCKDDICVRADSFSYRVEQLLASAPKAFLAAIETAVAQGKPSRTLLRMFMSTDRVVSITNKYSSSAPGITLNAITSAPEFLILDAKSLARLEANLQEAERIINVQNGVDGFKASNIVPHCPQWVLDFDKHKKTLALTIKALNGAFSSREANLFSQHFDMKTLAEGIQNCMLLIEHLLTCHKISGKEIVDLFAQEGEWIRSLTYTGFIPVSLANFLAQYGVDEIANFMLLDSASKSSIRQDLFHIFGKFSTKLLDEVGKFPDLILSNTIRQLAVKVSGIRSIYREEDIHARYPRWKSENLRPIVMGFQIAKEEYMVDQQVCLDLLTILDGVRLLDLDRIDLPPVIPERYSRGLARFLNVCSANPSGLDNFMFLVEGFRKYKLYRINPDEFRRMWQCAFDSIIAAPEVFLNRSEFDRTISKIEEENWQFAEMQIHEVLRREPLLAYHLLQGRYNAAEEITSTAS